MHIYILDQPTSSEDFFCTSAITSLHLTDVAKGILQFITMCIPLLLTRTRASEKEREKETQQHRNR